ncbi:hypothetical protein [Sphingomonas montana]|uniref:hypothetical protein n=1 Tax=Sphingomonas montana TaxID=1843236 RepID=UPI0013ED625D|nr:hypothetical protein [Sphingomonas montana]
MIYPKTTKRPVAGDRAQDPPGRRATPGAIFAACVAELLALAFLMTIAVGIDGPGTRAT